jgi:hypothetical protein
VSLGWLFHVVQTQGLNVRAIPHCNSEDYLAGLAGVVRRRDGDAEVGVP